MATIEIFRAGTHTGMDRVPRSFTRADIQAIAAGYSAQAHHAPVVIGHPATDAPAYAWVRGLTARGDDVLEAELELVDPAFAGMVKDGRFKHVSAAFFMPDEPHNPTPGQWSLRHVGFLGAQPPAVRGLKPAQFGAGAPFVAFTQPAPAASASPVLGLLRGLRDWLTGTTGAEEAERLVPAATLAAFAAPPSEETPQVNQPNPPAPPADPQAAAAEALRVERERLAAERAAFDGQRAAFAQAERAQRDAADATFLDGLVQQGRLLPANRADAQALLGALPEAEGPRVAFAAGERSPREALKELLTRQPVVVPLGKAAIPAFAAPDAADAGAIRQAAEIYTADQAKAGRHVSPAEAVAFVTQGGAA